MGVGTGLDGTGLDGMGWDGKKEEVSGVGREKI